MPVLDDESQERFDNNRHYMYRGKNQSRVVDPKFPLPDLGTKLDLRGQRNEYHELLHIIQYVAMDVRLDLQDSSSRQLTGKGMSVTVGV